MIVFWGRTLPPHMSARILFDPWVPGPLDALSVCRLRSKGYEAINRHTVRPPHSHWIHFWPHSRTPTSLKDRLHFNTHFLSGSFFLQHFPLATAFGTYLQRANDIGMIEWSPSIWMRPGNRFEWKRLISFRVRSGLSFGGARIKKKGVPVHTKGLLYL